MEGSNGDVRDGQVVTVSLADLARVAHRAGLQASLSDAARFVLDVLTRASGIDLLLVTPGKPARVVAKRDVFREGRRTKVVWSLPTWMHPQGRHVHVDGVEELSGRSGALAWQRERWQGVGRQPGRLDDPILPGGEHLAIRRADAQREFPLLFGLAPAALVRGAPLQLPSHDVRAWGEAKTDEATPRELVRMADVVRAIGERDGTAAGPASRAALCVVGAAGFLDLFVLQPGKAARPVCNEDLWAPAVKRGEDRLDDEAARSGVGLCAWRFGLPAREAVRYRQSLRVMKDGQHVGAPLDDKAMLQLPALRELRGGVGLLEWLGDWWGAADSFAWLDEGPEAAVAMLRSDVEWLFGIGETAASRALAAARSKSPLKLQPHVGDVWGLPKTAEPDVRALVRLADVVRAVIARDEEALHPAALDVLDVLAAAAPLELFLLQQGDRAVPLPDSVIWRQRSQSGKERLKQNEEFEERQRGADFVFIDIYDKTMGHDEVVLRGLEPNRELSGGQQGRDMSDEEWRAIPELPELRGAAGVLEWLRFLWGKQAKHDADLDKGPEASVAMLRSDVERLFGIAEAGAAVAALALMSALTPAQQLAKDYPPEGGEWPHVKGESWTDAEREAMFRMRWDKRRPSGKLIGEAIGDLDGQVVNDQIGAKNAWQGWRWEGAKASGWKPSDALLKECGLKPEHRDERRA